MRILVVDDSKAMRIIVMRTLRQAGFGGHDIEQAANGREALDAIHKQPPDLVLSDWNMPDMTGIELLRTLKAEESSVKFGFITSEGTEEMMQTATEAGALFVITKPFTPQTFENTLASVIT